MAKNYGRVKAFDIELVSDNVIVSWRYKEGPDQAWKLLFTIPVPPSGLTAETVNTLIADRFTAFRLEFSKEMEDLVDEAVKDFISDAPKDGKNYTRKDGGWVEITSIPDSTLSDFLSSI